MDTDSVLADRLDGHFHTTGGGHLYRVRHTGQQGWLLFPAARGD